MLLLNAHYELRRAHRMLLRRHRSGGVTEAQGIAQPAPWWSFTKTILAAAALALVRDGRLTLDRLVPNRPFHFAPTSAASSWPCELRQFASLSRSSRSWRRAVAGLGTIGAHRRLRLRPPHLPSAMIRRRSRKRHAGRSRTKA